MQCYYLSPEDDLSMLHSPGTEETLPCRPLSHLPLGVHTKACISREVSSTPRNSSPASGPPPRDQRGLGIRVVGVYATRSARFS